MILLALGVSALALVGILYVLVAAFAVQRLARRRTPQPAQWPSVSILKPLHGDEPELLQNLGSFLMQDYPAEVEILFGLQSPSDPALQVAEEIEAAFPGHNVRIVVDEFTWGANRKVSNLANLAVRARYDVMVLADSDMRVDSDYLRRVVAELSDETVGAVTCPYHGLSLASVSSRLVALGIDTHFLPGVAMSVVLGVGHPCLGSTIALRRETHRSIGGFLAHAGSLADDHELGRRVRALGHKVAVTPFSIGHLCAQTRLSALLKQEMRWSRTIRQIEPLGHLGAITTHPLPFALLALALWPDWLTGGLVAAALAARLALCLCVERAFGLPRHPYALLPIRDLLSFVVYTGSFLGRSVQWRGLDFDVARDGALLPRRVTPTTRSDAG